MVRCVDIRQVTEFEVDLEVYAIVASFMSTKQCSCDLCGSIGHLVASCPKLHELAKDPSKLRRLIRCLELIQQNRGGSTSNSNPEQGRVGSSLSRPGTPPASNRSSSIRSIEQYDTDEDAEVRSLGTDGDITDGETDPGASDF